MPATVVLVHGGWSGSWAWQYVTKELDARGVRSVAVDLPSCSDEDPSIDFRDDARHVRTAIDQVGGPVVLVGNSYGGLVITEAAAGHPSVKRLVYLAAHMPKTGQTQGDIIADISAAEISRGGPGLGGVIGFRDDGMVEITDLESAIEVVMPKAPDDAKDLRRGRSDKPMSLGRDPKAAVSQAAWETIRSTYVVCKEDLAIAPDYQRMAARERATDSVEWPSDHTPQYSRPNDVADLLEKLATEAG